MAKAHLNPCEAHFCTKFVKVPTKTCFSKFVREIQVGFQLRKSFKLKSSNGHTFNAVSSSGADNLLSKVNGDLSSVDTSSPLSESERTDTTLSITVVGASGDLAKKKIFPALFALYYEDCFPQNFTVFGFARTKMTDEELRNMISKTLTCRIDKRENCGDKMDHFLKRCFYHAGQYNSEKDFVELDQKLKVKEGNKLSNRLFYLSIPPNIFVDAVRCAGSKASSESGWTRVIVEKPFGRDSESSAELTRCLMKYLSEDQIFRIDHYLGKEVVENLSVLRFSNLVFEPLWSRTYIRNVQFIFSEDFGTEGRGGYFDNYGIIRDNAKSSFANFSTIRHGTTSQLGCGRRQKRKDMYYILLMSLIFLVVDLLMLLKVTNCRLLQQNLILNLCAKAHEM